MFRYNSGRSLVLGLVTHGNTSGWSEEDVRAHRSGWSEDEDDVASLTAGHPPVLWAFQTGDAHLTPLEAAHVGAGQTDRQVVRQADIQPARQEGSGADRQMNRQGQTIWV